MQKVGSLKIFGFFLVERGFRVVVLLNKLDIFLYIKIYSVT